MLTLEILCATMHQSDFSKIREMNIKTDVVFANQCDRTAYEEMTFNGHKAKMISTQTRGVGKNRNIALAYAAADVCLFADDDVVYCDGYEKTVLDFYDRHPDADVVIFNFLVSRNGSKPDNIVNKTGKIRGRKLSWGTYAISARRASLEWHNLKFHHDFGGGATYSCGEDTCFLNDCYSKRLKVYQCADTIGRVDHTESTWFEGYTDKFFIDKGVLFYKLVGDHATIAALYHCIKHRAEYSAVGWRKAFSLMRKGAKKAKKIA